MARTTTPERLREQAENSLDAARKAAEKANEKYERAAEKATEAAEKAAEAKTKRDEAQRRVAELEAFVNAATATPAPQVVAPEGTETAEVHGNVGGEAVAAV